MWQLDNQTPFTAERGWTRDPTGAEVWLVAVKATFDIDPSSGRTAIASDQLPVNKTAVYSGPPGASSLRYDSDLVPIKRGTDVILNAIAHAPAGRPVEQLAVTMTVGPLVKRLRVYGNRRWRSGAFGPALGKPEPFSTVPIVYERAYGGTTEAGSYALNPVGTGYSASRAGIIGQPVPNIEYLHQRIVSWRQRPEPAGFGAIGCHWRPRSDHAGTADARYFNERYPLLPEDLNERYYRAAPDDQQCQGYLIGGEPVVLENMTPAGRLVFVLPKMRLGFQTHFAGGVEHHSARLHTVIVEPDDHRVSLVWHSSLPCHHREDRLEKTVVFEKELV